MDSGHIDCVGKAPQSSPVFAAKLTPHRSLNNQGFAILMAFVMVSCLLPAFLFLIIGAWPVFLFLGLDVLLIWGAFKLNYRAAREFEEVKLWPDALQIRQVSSRGKSSTVTFNPFWARFKIEKNQDKEISEMSIYQSDKRISLGKFLNPDDRVSFSKAFSNALHSVHKLQPQDMKT